MLKLLLILFVQFVNVKNICSVTVNNNASYKIVLEDSSKGCTANICYKKCCPQGQIISTTTFFCVPGPPEYENWIPKFKNSYGKDIVTISGTIQPIYGEPTCNLSGPVDSVSWVLLSGFLYEPKLREYHNFDQYCIDIFYAPGKLVECLLSETC